MSKPEELVKVNSRVATFSRAVASSRPPPSPADNLVMVNSGARQTPPHATVSAFNHSDFNRDNCAVQASRYGRTLVHPARDESTLVHRFKGSVRLALKRTS